MYIRREVSNKDSAARVIFCEDETDKKICQAFITNVTKTDGIYEQFHNISKPIVYFSSFYTSKEYRSKGYGRKMLKYIKEYYKGYIVVLHVGGMGVLSNEQLVEFYKSEGFKEYESDSRHNPLLAIIL